MTSVVTLVEELNLTTGDEAILAIGGDIESCFTNISHDLVKAAWRFYFHCLYRRVACISSLRRGRKGKTGPFVYPAGSRIGTLIFTFSNTVSLGTENSVKNVVRM